MAPSALAALPAYTGTYAQEDPEGTIGTLEVRLEQDRLVLYQPGMRLGPLVPVSATRLHLMATPLDVEFVVEEGRARRLVLLRSSGQALCLSPGVTAEARWPPLWLWRQEAGQHRGRTRPLSGSCANRPARHRPSSDLY